MAAQELLLSEVTAEGPTSCCAMQSSTTNIFIQGAFFYCSAQKTTNKYKEKYQNCSVNCSSQKIQKTKYQNRDYGTCVFVHFYLACQSTFSSVMNFFSGQS